MATHYFNLDVSYVCAGQYAMNRFDYRIIDPSTTDDWVLAKELVNVIDDGGALSWTTKNNLIRSNQSFISAFRARQFAPTGGNTCSFVAEPSNFPGARLSGINTQQIAACINWIPTTSGPKMGRNFIPGIPEDALLGSRWEDDYVTAVDEFIAKHLSGFSTVSGVWEPIIWNREDETAALMSEGYLSPKPGTQRRRETPI